MSGGRCPNCGAAGPGRYCPECGQRQGDATRTLRFWLRRAADEALSLDGRIPRSLRLLLVRPGGLTLEWHRGRRASYSNPFRLALLAAVLMVAALELMLPDVPLPSRFLPLILLATSPALAWLVERMEGGSGRTYLEHLVTVLHLQVIYFLSNAVVLLGTAEEISLGEAGEVAGGAAFLWGAWYTVLAFRRVYGDGWLPALGKASAFWLAWWVILTLAVAAAGSAADFFRGSLPIG